MGSDGGSAEGTAERPTAQLKEWVLLEGSRGAIAAITAVVLFLFMLLVALSPVSPFGRVMPLFYVYGGLISGNLTVITVVVSINQLLLSRELMAPDELRTRIEANVEYRQEVEDSAGRVAPVEPQGFLRLVFENARQQAQQLRGLAINDADEDVAGELDDVVSRLTRKVDQVDELLQESDESSFAVLSTTLTTNYAREIRDLRRINFRRRDQLSQPVSDWIEDLCRELKNIDVARQYIKSIYIQQELAAVSRRLFYVGLPAVTVVAATQFLFTGAGGPVVPQSLVPVLAPAVVTVGLLPLAVLFAYVIRAGTVARRTAALVPFTAPTQEKER